MDESMRTRVLQEHSDLCGFIDHDVIEGYMFTGLGTDKELALQLCETSSLLSEQRAKDILVEVKAQLEATRKGVRVPAESKHALMPIVLNDLQLLAKKGQRVVA